MAQPPHISARHITSVGVALVLVSCQTLTPTPSEPPQGRHYDARPGLVADVVLPSNRQRLAEAQLRDRVEGLRVRYDDRSGAVHSLLSFAAPLAPRSPGMPETVATQFVNRQLDLLGLTSADVAERDLMDVVPDGSGATHLYWRQQHAGLAVYNGLLQVTVESDGSIRHLANAFTPDLAAAAPSVEPDLPASDAVLAAMHHLSLAGNAPAVIGAPVGVARETALDHRDIAHQPIIARLMWLPVSREDVRLVWNFRFYTLDGAHVFDFNVDANVGVVLTRFDWVAGATYRVYEQPVESPNHASPAPPPADARTVLTHPPYPSASPFGWHDTDGVAGAEDTRLRGNNVAVYLDRGNDDPAAPPAGGADCGVGLSCSFPLDLADPLSDTRAAAANVFYWVNLFHDVLANHGFDAPSGAFQANNYGLGGAPADPVLAELQNGYGAETGTELHCTVAGRPVLCRGSPNFLTLPDGSSGRLQLHLSDLAGGGLRDGGFDNGAITHELAHGVTSRLVGAPSSVSCTMAPVSISEGVSDYLALVFTQGATDTAATARSVATWTASQPETGSGVRVFPYTLDPDRNGQHHERIYDCVTPHCAGEVWGQALWDVHWKLFDTHGYSSDLNDGRGTRELMLNYLVSGLKRTRCGPDLMDARDGLLLSMLASPDFCPVMRQMARFGLGLDAVPEVSPGTDGANGHSLPHRCFGPSSDETLVPNPPRRDQGDDFGRSVVVRGDIAVVGAPGDLNDRGERSGAAYILVRDLGGWRIETRLTALTGAAGDRFGTSVDLSGDIAVVGAPRTNLSTARGTMNGAAFVFRRRMTSSGPRWEQEGSALEAFDASNGDHFGFSVAINSRRGLVVVGAPRFDGPARAGAAYLFERVADGFGGREWLPHGGLLGLGRSRLQPPGGSRGDEFGYAAALSIDGDTILIGAPSDDSRLSDAGAAYLYTRAPRSGRFTFAARLDGARSLEAMFGRSVALGRNLRVSGAPTLALVGAPGITGRTGIAYLFEAPASGWSSGLRGRRLYPEPGGGGGDRFGYSVDISGDHMVIAAPGTAPPPGGGHGSVYLIAHQGINWNRIRQVRRITTEDYGNYGDSVSVSAGVILVGASRDHATDSGGVFFYE